VCFCSLIYPGCNAHAPYYIVMCGLFGCTIVSHIRHNFRGEGAVFGPNMCVLTYSTTLSELFLTSRKIQRDNVVCTLSICYSNQILTKFEFSRQIFDKSSTFKLNKNSTSGSRVAPCGRTDRLTHRADMTKLITLDNKMFTDVMPLR